MARLRGPSVRQFYYTEGARKGQMMPAGVRVSLYSDEACTQPADALALDESPLPAAAGIPYVEIQADLQADEFLFPDVQDPAVYYRIGSTGPVGLLYPNGDARTDQLFGFLQEVETNLADITATAVAASTAAATPVAVAASLDATVVAMQANRRAGFADRALLGAGGWYIKRRNADELRLMRDVGDGFVADHQIVRGLFPISNTGPATGPAGEPKPMLLNDIGIGLPMIPVTFDAATYSGSGWATVAGYFGGQIAPLLLGLDAAYPTVSTTAGSTTVTITSGALLPGLRYNTRRVVIPGAGTGGTDLVTAVGSMAGNGLSFTVGTAVPTAVSNVTAQIFPGRRSSATAAAAAVWTAPVGATSLGIVLGMGGNGGFTSVAIDGDLTRANFLPTAQELVDRGIAPSSILTTGGGTVLPTTRILDSYNLIELWSVWTAFASGLDPSVAHTVTATVTGYKRNASASTRLIVGGWGYGMATTTPTTATALPFIAYRCGKSTPVHEVAVDHQPSGTTTHSFVAGHNHGYEYVPTGGDPRIVVDGALVTLADDQAVAVAGSATITRVSNLYHSQNTATPTFTARTTYRLDRSGMSVNVLLEALIATVVDSAYFGSFTATYAVPRVQVDKDATAYNMLTDAAEEVYVGTGRNTAAAWWDPAGPGVAVLLVPTAQAQTGNWSSSPVPSGVRNFPTTSQSSKWYARRTGSMAVGARWAGEVTYVIGRLPDGAAAYFPVQ